MIQATFYTDNEKTTIIIRALVDAVILSEGVQKLLFKALRGGDYWSFDHKVMSRG